MTLVLPPEETSLAEQLASAALADRQGDYLGAMRVLALRGQRMRAASAARMAAARACDAALALLAKQSLDRAQPALSPADHETATTS